MTYNEEQSNVLVLWKDTDMTIKLNEAVKVKITALLSLPLLISGAIAPAFAHATTINPTPSAKVSFTFDDSQASSYTQAAPTLAKYGLTGTNYASSGCVGKTTVPNTCLANQDVPYMSWVQLQALQNTYGWEIGSHTVDHKCLASNATIDPSDCQTATLTTAQVDAELSASKAALAAHGITATDFAPPYGDYNNSVLAEIAKYYASMRGFQDSGYNAWPNDDYLLRDVMVRETVTPVSTIEADINTAIANNSWLVLSFHDIAPTPSQNPDDYQYGTSELAQIAAYVKAKQDAGVIKSVHVSQGLVTSDTNLLGNNSFVNGIANGWHTDNPAAITADAGNHGSYPSPTNSIKLTSATSDNAHLFSPAVAVSPATTYMFKNFLNVKTITSGEVAFYVDEYDVNGNWISGQYLKRENSAFVEDLNFAYKPSSLSVAKASLQVIVAGTGITGYLDNSQLFPLTTTTVPQRTNLLTNGTFDAGISGVWSTDASSTITANTANNGSPSNPVNSVKLTAGATNGHLFSPAVAVNSTHSYTLSNYLNLTAITSGEVAFYVDEYDVNGNWISGQYKLGVHTVGAGDVNLAYNPSTANVAKASLQVIVVGNSGIAAYFDDSRWYQN